MSTLQVMMKNLNPILIDPYANVTPYLADEDIITLTEELERRAFERKHGDIHLKISNLRDFASTLFATTKGSTRWEVQVILDGTTRWRGEVSNKSITFSLDTAWCEFDAFSKTKILWERAKQVKVFIGAFPPGYEANGYIGIGNFLPFESAVTNLSLDESIFSGFTFNEYAARNIRGVTSQGFPAGNEGRLQELDPRTTLAQLLTAFQVYYNCEFLIDHATRKLVMRRRGAVDSTTPKSIDAVLCDDVEPKVQWLDDMKVDYIYTIGAYRLEPVTFLRLLFHNTGGLDPGTHSYLATATIDGVEGIVSRGALSAVAFPVPGNIHLMFLLSLPLGPAGTTRRTLYKYIPRLGAYKLLTYVNTNTYAEYGDAIPLSSSLWDGQQTLPANIKQGVKQWIGFDEVNGTWRTPVIDYSQGQSVVGTVLEVLPRLSFTEIGMPTSIKPDEPYDVFSFFARETDYLNQTFREQWIDVFRTKRKAICKVKDMDYVLNQPITCARLPNDLTPSTNYVVKRFSSRLMKEETELELLSV